MGINPTPTNHRSFTFDGKSTREFGVYTTGKDVFNSPERAVEMISIPGRDGEYALDRGHFNNIEVTYRAGIVADSTTDFAEAISNFRNWLASREGYCRLTDEYNTEEYRMAVFKNAIALEHEGLLTGEFDVTFDCKPQRYLAIGEELVEIGAWGNTETAEGEVVTIDASSDTAVKALTADIEPIQDLNGYDAPWVGGAGKNKLPCLKDGTYSGNGVKAVVTNGVATFSGTTIASGNAFSIPLDEEATVPSQTCYLHALNSVQNASIAPSFELSTDVGNTNWNFALTPINRIYEIPSTRYGVKWDRVRFYLGSGVTISGTFAPMICLTNTDTDFAPYSNICPISGHDDVTVTVEDDVDNPTVSEDYTTTLPSTTYGGTLDVVSGLLTVTHITETKKLSAYNVVSTGTNTVHYRLFTSVYNTSLPKYSEGNNYCNIAPNIYNSSDTTHFYPNTANGRIELWVPIGTDTNTDVQIVCELATPQTYQLTPQQIALLLGENNIFADSGNVTVEYGHNPTLLTNPTWFPSKPLLAVEGYGLLKLGKSEIDLDNVPVGDITLLDDSRFKLTQTAANTYSVTFTIDEGALNVGDDITASINALPFRFYIVGDGASISPSSYTVADTNSDFVSSLSLGYGGSSADFSGETVINVKFDSGTSSTITNTVSGNLVVKKTYPTPTSNITLTYTVTETVDYDASAHTITLTETATITYSSAYITSAQLRTTSLGASALITAYSTISIIQDEVFIDCDIGEAYTIKDGEPISLNQHIDLGSDLPTLPSGDTEVTYDNTITKVEVKPNWWKV